MRAGLGCDFSLKLRCDFSRWHWPGQVSRAVAGGSGRHGRGRGGSGRGGGGGERGAGGPPSRRFGGRLTDRSDHSIRAPAPRGLLMSGHEWSRSLTRPRYQRRLSHDLDREVSLLQPPGPPSTLPTDPPTHPARPLQAMVHPSRYDVQLCNVQRPLCNVL